LSVEKLVCEEVDSEGLAEGKARHGAISAGNDIDNLSGLSGTDRM